MKTLAWITLFVVMGGICAGLFTLDANLTDAFFYNNGYHLNCGGRWIRGDRAVSVNWCYCSYCGCERTFCKEYLPTP